MKTTGILIAFLLASCTGTDTPDDSRSDQVFWPKGQVIDLSYAYNDDTIYWPTADPFEKTTDFEGMTDGGYFYSAYSVRTAEHGGTHLDAPVHFAEGKLASDELPVEDLMGPAILIDVSGASDEDRDYLISATDFQNWEARHGTIPDGSIVLLRTGFGRFWPDAEKYMGTAERGADAVSKLHFPGIDPEAATWLVENRSIHAIGIDTPSIDRGQSTLFESHRILFADNIPAFENVANLDQLPESGFVVIALPMKIAGGSGGPLRIVAIIPDGDA